MTRDPDVREWICRTLSALFDRVPATLDPLPGSAAPASALALAHAFASHARADTEADQVRLFVNARDGVPAPPYASWFLDGELMGAAAQDALSAYASQGLEVAPDAGAPPDALSAELEFLLFLARHERAARTTHDAAALAQLEEAQRTFLTAHVARWIPLFVQAVRQAQPGPVYAAAVTLLDEWLHSELARLDTAAPMQGNRQ